MKRQLAILMLVFLSAGILLAVAQLPNALAVAPENPNNTLRIILEDSNSFHPIQGATVTITGYTYTYSGVTDVNGQVVFNPENDFYTITVADPGYIMLGTHMAIVFSSGGGTSSQSQWISLCDPPPVNDVPEVPIGSIVASIAMAIALLSYIALAKNKKALPFH